jgi:ribosome-interacting GTPase 1
VHKDFAEKLKFARLYRLSGEPSGLMVDRTHVVEDKDILEFHI